EDPDRPAVRIGSDRCLSGSWGLAERLSRFVTAFIVSSWFFSWKVEIPQASPLEYPNGKDGREWARSPMRGSRPQKLPAPSPTSQGGRICPYPGCEPQPTIHNLGPRCRQHADIALPNYRRKRTLPNPY